jgi:hypothetical protein
MKMSIMQAATIRAARRRGRKESIADDDDDYRRVLDKEAAA